MVEEGASVLTPPGKKMKQARLPFAPVNKQPCEDILANNRERGRGNKNTAEFNFSLKFNTFLFLQGL